MQFGFITQHKYKPFQRLFLRDFKESVSLFYHLLESINLKYQYHSLFSEIKTVLEV